MIEGSHIYLYLGYFAIYLLMGILTANSAYGSIKDIDFTDETWERIAIGFVGAIWPVFCLAVVYALIVQWKNE